MENHQRIAFKKFEQRVKHVILFNEEALRHAYLHPFQQVNKKLYSENNRISKNLQNQMTGELFEKGFINYS